MGRRLDETEVRRLREEFPIFKEYPRLIYFDNAATSQKPGQVLEAEKQFYQKYNANPFRGMYGLSEYATGIYENARDGAAGLIGAQSGEEIIFTRNATESLNLLAYSLCGLLLQPGDEIAVTVAEHHSNLVPWQQAAKRAKAKLRFIECGNDGAITDEAFENAIGDRTRIVAVTHMSNVFGRINDVRKLSSLCRERKDGAQLKDRIAVVLDGAQSVPHIPVDVRKLGIDFLAFSGHKMLAPMGIGVLWGRREYLEKMPPFLCGGEMVDSVSREGAVFAGIPHKFEAGTVNAGGAAGLEAAVRYIGEIGMSEIGLREKELTQLMLEQMNRIPHIHIIGGKRAEDHHGIVAFTVEGVHSHDAAAVLAADDIAVRAGYHCAQPLFRHLKMPPAVRASLAFYNTEEEVERFAGSLNRIRRKMGYGE